MKINLIAKYLLYLKYTGTSSTKTLVVDGDGGTSSAGLITLTDSSAHAFDLGSASYNTGTKLMAGINALDGWSCIAYGTSPVSGVFGEHDISGQDLLADVSVEVPNTYVGACPFASETVVVANGAADATIVQGVPHQMTASRGGFVSLEVAVTPNAGSASGNVTVSFARSGSPLQANGVFPSLDLSDFHTQDLDDIVVAVSSTSGERVAEIIDVEVGSSAFICPVDVSNASGQEVQVEVNVVR